MTQEAKTERRRLVARRVFEALCAQYPRNTLRLCKQATRQTSELLTTAQSPSQQPPITV